MPGSCSCQPKWRTSRRTSGPAPTTRVGAPASWQRTAAVVIARRPDDFPLGPTGKVLKRELRTRHAGLLR